MPLVRVMPCLLALVSTLCVFDLPASAATTANPQLVPYTVSLIAGGASANPAAGASCGTGSTLTSTDAYGDGCLATQVKLGTAQSSKSTVIGPQFVTSDDKGNTFFSDTSNGLVRRVDARTGIITAVAGGASASPAAGAACGSFTSTDVLGDGCLATAVKLNSPEGLAFSPITRELFFVDSGTDTVRRIALSGTISTAAGNTGNVFGYAVNNSAGNITAANSATSYLNFPYGLAFDRAGNMYIADEGNNAIEAVNMQSTTVKLGGVSVPPGTIAKLMGYGDRINKSTAGECPNFTAATTAGRGGCYFGKYTEGATAVTSLADSPYDLSVDVAGNIFFANEFNTVVVQIRTDGTVVSAAGIQGNKPVGPGRGPATSTAIGSDYGVTVDALSNIYIADSTAGLVWRVDAANGGLYVLAGGASTVCPGASDTFGDGCPALQAKFSANAASATSFATGPAIQGLKVDSYGNLLVADGSNTLIRRIATGAQFPTVTVNGSVTQTLDIHLGTGDASATYTLPSGFTEFTLGTATCTANSDTTADCLLPVTFKPSAPGFRSAPLTVKSSSGLTSSFALTGTGLGAILAVDPGTRATLSSTGLSGVAAVALDNAGNTFAVVPGNASLTKITATGVSSSVGTGLANAAAVAVDGAGNVYAGLSSGTIVEIPASGAAQFTVGSGFSSVSGLATDSSGNLFVTDSVLKQVSEILADTRASRILATAASAGLSGPSGVAVDAAGNVFVSDPVNNNVVEISPAGAVTTLGSGLSGPADLALDAAGSVYVADTKNGRIVMIPNESGKLTTADQIVIINGLTSPSAVAVANNGTVTVADSSLNAIYTYTRNGAAISFGNDPIGTQLTLAADIASVGNQAVTLGTTYYTATGNTSDFSLTPSNLSSGTTLAAGNAAALTAGFNPTTTGARSAVYTFASTNATPPALTLTGNGITPVNATTTGISATPVSGTYGQIITATFTVATTTGAIPTGTVNVKVDTTSYTPTLTGGAVTLSFPGLGAGAHTITATYPGDANNSPSTAIPVTITLAKAPLNIAVNNTTKQYLAPLPTFTGTLTGVVNNDQIGVSYTTTATQTSPLGSYPITATPAGTAVNNYNVTTTPGTLTIVKANTGVSLTASGTSVSSLTSVTLTATVASTTSGTPTGTVTFFNGATAIGGPVNLNNQGVASTSTTFPLTGQSSSNVITAVYSGDGSYATSTSSSVTVLVSSPGFNLTGTASGLIVQRGQTGVTSFTLTPTFGYTGTIGFACTGLPATVGCNFAPTTVTAAGNNASSLITVGFTTVQPAQLALHSTPRLGGPDRLPALAFAGIPGFLLLAGFLGRRKGLHAVRMSRLFVLAGLLSVMLLGTSGCGNGRFTSGTPAGTYAITVVATGTPASGTANIVQSFTINLTVQ